MKFGEPIDVTDKNVNELVEIVHKSFLDSQEEFSELEKTSDLFKPATFKNYVPQMTWLGFFILILVNYFG